MSKQLVFLCGARDFHAMDWYKSAIELCSKAEIVILTDLIAGEGFKKLISPNDKIEELIILDKFLLTKQSKIGNLWRNLIKLIVFPMQVYLVKRYSKKNPGAVYHAHAMYYLFLAWAAGLEYVGTPQGSDILIKPFKSRLFRYFAVKSLKAASAITVDSEAMKEKTYLLSGRTAHIIQNGIDTDAISNHFRQTDEKVITRDRIISIRGFTPLYRIKEIVDSRNSSSDLINTPISFIYPFHDEVYVDEVLPGLKIIDENLGRIDRAVMYNIFYNAKLILSIPSSDSSPRSVYEGIFCGCAVAITYNKYYEALPNCMKSRIILVDITNVNWLNLAIKESERIIKSEFFPSNEALELFDQKRSFKKIEKLLFNKP